jgi:ribonuclease D
VAEFERIENVTDLASLARSLAAEPVVAIDTEADSFYHYFDKTCLVQIATPKRIFLVDPLALDGPSHLAPLGAVFASKKVRKIFHAGEYDLFVLKRDCGFQFANLFDTMICAQLLGYPSVGLAALAERHFGVRLPKDEQRSDWSSRPLRDSQLAYAAADVTHLIALAERLEAELKRASRWEWALEEFETLAHRSWPEREFDKLGYLRIKGARALGAEGLAILRELYWMRDRRARQVDRPPFKILGNRTLIELAEQAPETDADLAKIKGMTELMLRRLARDVLGAVARGKKRKHGPVPKGDGSGRRRMDRPAERRLAALKRWRAERARELALDPGVLCPNSALETMAVHNPARVEDLRGVAGLKGWLVREFGREIVKELAAAAAEAPGD